MEVSKVFLLRFPFDSNKSYFFVFPRRGRVLLFFVVLISLLELLRQISPLEYTMEVKSEEFYQKYHKYIVLFEKLFGLCLAWYVSIWITLLSRRRRGGAGARSSVSDAEQTNNSSVVESNARRRRGREGRTAASATVDLSGIWIKDRKKSDSLAGVCKIANVNFILRKAICLVRGSELKQTEEGLKIRVFSEIPWFSLNEWYEFKTNTLNKRRDLRRGHMNCTMRKTKTGLTFYMEWPEPWGGYESTEYILRGEHTLQVKTDCTIRDKSISYQTLYHRRH